VRSFVEIIASSSNHNSAYFQYVPTPLWICHATSDDSILNHTYLIKYVYSLKRTRRASESYIYLLKFAPQCWEPLCLPPIRQDGQTLLSKLKVLCGTRMLSRLEQIYRTSVEVMPGEKSQWFHGELWVVRTTDGWSTIRIEEIYFQCIQCWQVTYRSTNWNKHTGHYNESCYKSELIRITRPRVV